MATRGVALSTYREGKLYSEALRSEKNLKRFKLIKSKESLSPETIKGLLKSKINPTEIKVRINTFKSIKNRKVSIKTNNEEEIEVLEKDINIKCGENWKLIFTNSGIAY